MATFIEIGPVPSKEALSTNAIQAALMAGAFLRQLNRTKPLPLESGARYTLAQRKPGTMPWITVQLAVQGDTWSDIEKAHELAEAHSFEVAHWDAVSLQELSMYSFSSTAQAAPVAIAA